MIPDNGKYRRQGRVNAGVLAAVIVVMLALAMGYVLGRRHAPSSMEEMAGAEGTKQATTLYTCGMHPEVIQDEPGNCPKCGMKLVPMDADRAKTIQEARGGKASEETPKKDRKILYWRAPMDPAYIRDKPGKSPMGMDLVPVYEDEVSGGATIRIDPVTEQNMGIRYDVVETGPTEKVVRTVGTVDYDEQGLGTVATKIDGWVEKVYADTTGAQVHQGDPLFEFYAPQLFSAQQEYLVALRDVEKAGSASVDRLKLAQDRLASSRERLQFFDISDEQIATLIQEKQVRKTMTITSPVTGIVTHKNVVEGEAIKAMEPAYKIADVSTVWVIGKVFESDIAYIKLGQEVQMELDYMPGRIYRGRVTYVYPYLQTGTREIPVRTEFSNPGYDLKPGMYATLEFRSRLQDEAVLVPAMAVIDTGTRKVAYVMREPGKFEPRQIETGVRTGDNKWQVLSGLAPGEKVVVSGHFLLDSESRLREASLKMLEPGLKDTDKTFESGSTMTNHGEMTSEAAPAAPSESQKYVCPMPAHAGILYDQPGT
ncbi:MAG: efflux RND transporter periplasmic adaptor subunit, partial [Candidatus Hydrogenedentes bacterium]|nr:efflux RND transporter periplasmic adaptor subunit [Candidatus Hydrogenedentota bacterium]